MILTHGEKMSTIVQEVVIEVVLMTMGEGMDRASHFLLRQTQILPFIFDLYKLCNNFFWNY